MAYDAKPTVEDVILFADPEMVRDYVALMTRVGVAGMGDTIKEWRGAEIDRMVEDGLLRRGKPGPVTADDETFLRTAFEFCRVQGFGPLPRFERSLGKAVAEAEGRLEAAHEAVDEGRLMGVRTPVEEAAIRAFEAVKLPLHLSDWRMQDVHRHLAEVLEARLSEDGPSVPGTR